MGNPGKDAGRCLSAKAAPQPRRFLFEAVWLAFAGCAIGPSAVSLPQDFIEPPSSSSAARQQLAETGAETTAKRRDEPAEAPSKPAPYKPRTLPQAVCDYLQRLRCPAPPAEAKNGTQSSNAEKKEAGSENGAKE